MTASPFNRRPGPVQGSNVGPPAIHQETEQSVLSSLSPIPEVTTPPESASEDEMDVYDSEVPGGIFEGPPVPELLVHAPPEHAFLSGSAPETQIHVPATISSVPEPSPSMVVSTPPGSSFGEAPSERAPQDPTPTHPLPSTSHSTPEQAIPTANPEPPIRPMTPRVNLIRPTPENSQEAAIPALVPLQPTPPQSSMQLPVIPKPDSSVPELTCPETTLPGTTIFAPMQSTEAESLVPVDPVPNPIPEAAVPDPTCPETAPVPAVSVPEPPLAHGTSLPVALPLSQGKHKRARASSVRPSSSVPDRLGVPDSGTRVRTRSTSLAASFSSGPRTRSVSRSRTPSVLRGEKRKAEDSGDDWENKRQKA